MRGLYDDFVVVCDECEKPLAFTLKKSENGLSFTVKLKDDCKCHPYAQFKVVSTLDN